MSMDTLKEAFVQLSPLEREAFEAWIEEWREAEWDRQIEQDFTPGGRAAGWMAHIEQASENPDSLSLEEGPRMRREQHVTK